MVLHKLPSDRTTQGTAAVDCLLEAAMGKSGKTKGAKSATKAEAKAVKKAKAASKAERSQNKKAKDLVSADSKASKNSSKGKGKAKQKEIDDDEDLIQTLEEYRRRWEEGELPLIALKPNSLKPALMAVMQSLNTPLTSV